MRPHEIRVLPDERVVSVPEGGRLARALANNGIPIVLPCRERGVCGKCLVEVLAGAPAPPDAAEQALLARRGLPESWRLACRLEARGPLTIRIPEESRPATAAPLVDGRRRSVMIDPPVRKIALTAPPASLADPVSALDGLMTRFPGRRPRLAPEALAVLAGLDSGREETVTAVLGGEDRILALEPGDTTARSFGAAVDLGTTTVVAEIVDLRSGRTMAAAAGLNGQFRFGADVVSRITAAHLDPAQGLRLREEAVKTIDAIVGRARREAGLEAGDLYEIVVAGNTAMNHLLLGLPVGSLALAPFRALFSVLEPLDARSVGLEMNPAGSVYLAPNIRSFVGGDIAAGLLAADIENGPERILFLDLGTNGEIVVKNGSRLLATSTAAGPAFEGMGLSCGMIAAPGAVTRASRSGGGLALEVLGGGEAAGICGSGLIDILAEALDLEWLEARGTIRAADKVLRLSPALALSQKDVREVQLAAAAVRTGVRMLLEQAGLSVDDLDRIYVAGAFGSTLDIAKAMRIGLLPSVPAGKIEFIGNASLAGARIILLSSAERRRCEDLTARIAHLPLAQDEKFQDVFIEALEFRKWP